jgi:hypothetical protein
MSMVPANIDQASREKRSLCCTTAWNSSKLGFSWTRRWKCRNQVTVEAVPTLPSIPLELQIKGRGEVEVDDEKPWSGLLRQFSL